MSSYSSYSSYRGAGSSSHGRGRGGRHPSNRGRGHNVIAQMGKQKLIASDLSHDKDKDTPGFLDDIPKDHPLAKAYLDYSKEKKAKESLAAAHSFANISKEDSSNSQFQETGEKEVILLLEEKDLQWKDNPDFILQRYLNKTSFVHGSLRQRQFYEGLLISTKSVEITHHSSNSRDEINGNFNFSKLVIKKIISFEEWGFSPLAEREWFSPAHKCNFKFNYWDYIHGLSKVLLYDNENKRHSWFLKICENCFHSPIPNWFFSWWKNFGTSSSIFPDHMKSYIKDWMLYSPAVNNCTKLYQIDSSNVCLFFIEFGIPWIWKWKPIFGYDHYMIPCLKRQGLSKYWEKLDRICPNSSSIEGADLYETINKKIQFYKKEFEDRSRPLPVRTFQVPSNNSLRNTLVHYPRTRLLISL